MINVPANWAARGNATRSLIANQNSPRMVIYSHRASKGEKSMNILVTGATGFIGSRLVPFLRSKGHVVVTPGRDALETTKKMMKGVDAVVHLAAIAHTDSADAGAYERVNYRLPIRLAIDAKNAGIKRFIFMSSTHAATHRQTPYGATKARTESDLMAMNGIEIVILRAPLVYGPGVKGNVKSLLSLSRLPVPLPFGSADKKRSLIYIENLTDAVEFLLLAKAAGGNLYTATDRGSVSVAEILTQFRSGRGRSPRLFNAPWLEPALRAAGKTDLAEKLLGESLHDGTTLFAFGWEPPFETKNALASTAAGKLIGP